jgi:hypothetical protein
VELGTEVESDGCTSSVIEICRSAQLPTPAFFHMALTSELGAGSLFRQSSQSQSLDTRREIARSTCRVDHFRHTYYFPKVFICNSFEAKLKTSPCHPRPLTYPHPHASNSSNHAISKVPQILFLFHPSCMKHRAFFVFFWCHFFEASAPAFSTRNLDSMWLEFCVTMTGRIVHHR